MSGPFKQKMIKNITPDYLAGFPFITLEFLHGIGQQTLKKWFENIPRTKLLSGYEIQEALIQRYGIKVNKPRIRKDLYYSQPKKRLSTDTYRVLNIGGRSILEHRYVTGAPQGMIVHHVNGIKSDNRQENLIVMTPQDHRKLHTLLRWAHLELSQTTRRKQLILLKKYKERVL